MSRWCERSRAVRPEESDLTLLGSEGLGDAVDLLQVGLERGLARPRRRGRPQSDRIRDVPGPYLAPAREQRLEKARWRRHPVPGPDGDRSGKGRVRAVVLGARDELLPDASPEGEAAPVVRASRRLLGAFGETVEAARVLPEEVGE